MIRAPAAIAVLAVMLFVGEARSQKIQETRREPAPQLPQEAGCTRWEGRVEGNDKVLARIRLCVDGTRVTGLFQWSSSRSGWNEREIQGSASEGETRLALRDVRFVTNKVNPGWRFCLVDRYDLTRDGDRLTGTYESKACRDRATIDLQRVPDDPVPPKEEPAASASPVVPVPPVAPDPPEKARGACACRAGAVGNDRAAGMAIAGLLVAAATFAARRRGRDPAARLPSRRCSICGVACVAPTSSAPSSRLRGGS